MMKLTKEQIESQINDVEYIVRVPLTICILTTISGFKVIGTSSCIDVLEFKEHLGEEYAYKNALDKLWELEGYIEKFFMAGDFAVGRTNR